MSKNYKEYIFLSILFLAVLLTSNFILGLVKNDSIKKVSNEINTLSLSVFVGENDIKFEKEIYFREGQKLSQVLEEGFREGHVEFKTIDYGGMMGEFVESINNYKNERKRWWQYWINDKYSKVGISNYFPRGGDKIVFKLVEYQNSYEQ
jgi:hypothetical protein